MNLPEIHPTLTLVHPTDGTDMDSVFVHVESTCGTINRWNVDMYWDGSYQPISSMKELTIEEARKWWNTLVKKGYTRKTKGQWTELQNES